MHDGGAWLNQGAGCPERFPRWGKPGFVTGGRPVTNCRTPSGGGDSKLIGRNGLAGALLRAGGASFRNYSKVNGHLRDFQNRAGDNKLSKVLVAAQQRQLAIPTACFKSRKYGH